MGTVGVTVLILIVLNFALLIFSINKTDKNKKEMKQAFRTTKLNARSLGHLDKVNSIIEDYQAQGYKLTLRQLYYQLVSRNVIANHDREYKKLSRILTEGRMAGYVDWDAIEDRLRIPQKPYYNVDVLEALNDAHEQYRYDRQLGQTVHLEVWVEKDAISNVLRRVTEKYGVNILVNRGYGSVTTIKDSYERFRNSLLRRGNDIDRAVILYLGDHDPSGLDMIRDINKRVSEMMQYDQLSGAFSIEPIALTMKQIRKYNPPPNPAKITDSRSPKYIEEYGRVSWEVDALPPEVLHKVLEDAILSEIEINKYDKLIEVEVKDKEKMLKFIGTYEDFEDKESE